MAFTINTNIASLQSQEYLRMSSELQQKTINRVTSGLRIISSGDDAAGLAIANGFRSDRAVLTQGVRNANDGLSTLQTIDGGLNNISQLLDRARSLAAQSASGTFTGDRTLLNSEFQSVVDEIDRQAQAIGLDATGLFATKLSVFIGGGRGPSAADQIQNGSVAVDLSASTVDGRSLGLKGLQVTGALATDVDDILADTTNTSSTVVPGSTEFFLRGAGFSDEGRVRLSVNLSGVDDAEKLVNAINSAIEQAGGAGTNQSEAFKNANIRAVIVTDAQNNRKVVFQSSTAAFQVSGGDRLANALLGNASAEGSSTGAPLDYLVNGGGATASTGTAFAAAGNVVVRIQSGSLAQPADITLAVTTATTVNDALTSLSSLVAANSSLIAAGIGVTANSPGAALEFSSRRGENFEVLAVGDAGNVLGLGSAQFTAGTASASFDVSSITSAAVAGAATQTLGFSIGGGGYVTGAFTQGTSASVATLVSDLNTFFSQNPALQQAGLAASTAAGGAVTIASNNGSFFRVNVNAAAGGGNLGFGTAAGVTATASVSTASATTAATINSGGASSSGMLAFTPIRGGDDDQTITLSIKDASGNQQSLAITLQDDGNGQTARSIDEALDHMNTQIQAAGSEDLRSIVAVKQRDPAAGGVERIVFLSPLKEFRVSVGDNAGDTGLMAGTGTSQGSIISSSVLPGGVNIDISTQATAVSQLGKVQAVVGRGQNQFNFAISLAQTQIINLAASESRIRDADLAAEAANLSKAQVLQQAGIAALAQANSAPQAVLSLLQG